MINQKINKNYVYMLECSDGTYYTGWTNDIEKRLLAHNTQKGAKYTKNRLPAFLIYYEECETKIIAMQREYAIKHLMRTYKEEMVRKLNYKKKEKIEKINKSIFHEYYIIKRL